MKKYRKARRLLSLALSFLLLLFAVTACAAKVTENTNSAIDPAQLKDNYDASVAWIRLEEVPELGSGIIYREINELEKFMGQIEGPVVFCLVQYEHAITSMAVAYLERLAEQNPNVVVVLAKQSSDDKYLEQFKPLGWPAFYLFHDSEQEEEYFGVSEQMEAAVYKFVEAHGK